MATPSAHIHSPFVITLYKKYCTEYKQNHTYNEYTDSIYMGDYFISKQKSTQNKHNQTYYKSDNGYYPLYIL